MSSGLIAECDFSTRQKRDLQPRRDPVADLTSRDDAASIIELPPQFAEETPAVAAQPAA